MPPPRAGLALGGMFGATPPWTYREDSVARLYDLYRQKIEFAKMSTPIAFRGRSLSVTGAWTPAYWSGPPVEARKIEPVPLGELLSEMGMEDPSRALEFVK